MAWQYRQGNGVLSRSQQRIASGYSGAGQGRNNPGMEGMRNVGPIPRGRYTISVAYRHPNKGAIVMRLTPIGHNAHNRTDFLIHGDSMRHPGNGSQGCIILPRNIREQISHSGDRELEVVE
jgi:hypothetical protein